MADQSKFVPEWAKRVVWYQIFPERFCNGDPSNDPTLESLKGSWPYDHTSPWQVSPWTADWYRLQGHEQANGRDIWFNLQRRRYGGDLQGIKDRLDYLQALGVSALYLNPVFASPSVHKYDGATYHHIDPHFGPDPNGDRRLIDDENPADPGCWVWTSADRLMLELIQDVHRRDMRIIFDGVFNHMGWTSWPFQDVVANQQQSPFRDWFKVRSWDDPVAGTKFAYDGWFGVENLPELKQDERGIVSGPRDYIFAATRRWMDPNADGDPDDGIDGWRLDVAFCVRHAFWKDWREHVRSINPDAYLVAEVIEAVPDQTPYLTGDEFDAVMNYNFGFACAEFFISQKDRIWASEFDRRLQQLREAYPAEVALGMMNLFASHDSNRLASQIVNRDGPVAYRQWSKYHRWSQAQHNPSYDTRKPTADEVQIQKLLAIFQMTYVGAPLIYYGDEAGMWGANDPCCRKPMVWPELNYEEEATLPNGKMKFRPDPVHFDEELFRHYQRLIHIRNRSPALQLGDFRTLLCDDTNDIYAFARQHGGEQVIVVLNNHHAMQQVTLLQPGTFVDHLNQDARYQSLDGKLCLAVAAKWGCILRRQDRLETMGSSTT